MMGGSSADGYYEKTISVARKVEYENGVQAATTTLCS